MKNAVKFRPRCRSKGLVMHTQLFSNSFKDTARKDMMEALFELYQLTWGNPRLT